MCQLCIHEKGSRQIFNRSLSKTREKCNTELVIRCALSPAQTMQVIYLRLTCNWTFELLAMACNRSFSMLNILQNEFHFTLVPSRKHHEASDF